MAVTTDVDADAAADFIRKMIAVAPDKGRISSLAAELNRVTDLAVLLEPLYWPAVTGRRRFPLTEICADYDVALKRHHDRAVALVAACDSQWWMKAHEGLRVQAAWKDENHEVYLLLRLASWTQREKLKGQLAGALWLRHMAEVLRRGFEEVQGVEWREEDEAFGVWFPGGRKIAYGFDRPLDHPSEARPYLALSFGLHSGSVVRWYVEGDTEYAAVLQILPQPAEVGIELVNLKGNIGRDKPDIALKLRDMLEEDRTLRRFSMVSLDGDVPANVKYLKKQIAEDRIVGLVRVHEPDFEFANFSLEELIEVAGRLDEADGHHGDTVRSAGWPGIASGSDFQGRYLEVSEASRGSLKGSDWGKALALYAIEHPQAPDGQDHRPFLRDLSAAMHARTTRYYYHLERRRIDPETFELVERQET